MGNLPGYQRASCLRDRGFGRWSCRETYLVGTKEPPSLPVAFWLDFHRKAEQLAQPQLPGLQAVGRNFHLFCLANPHPPGSNCLLPSCLHSDNHPTSQMYSAIIQGHQLHMGPKGTWKLYYISLGLTLLPSTTTISTLLHALEASGPPASRLTLHKGLWVLLWCFQVLKPPYILILPSCCYNSSISFPTI